MRLVEGYRALNEYDVGTVILDIETKTWKQGGYMILGRNCHGLSVLDSGTILACGVGYYGDNGENEQDTRQRLQLQNIFDNYFR